MAKTRLEIIYGAASIFQLSPEEVKETFEILHAYNVRALDTAFLYPQSELTLGKYDAPKQFTIHTKAPALTPKAQAKQNMLDGCNKSLSELGIETIDLYYLHGPDPTVPIEETLSAIQELYAAGKIKRFGLSNYSASDVQHIYDIQRRASSVLPTVYQGNYNAVARHSETELLPLLRSLKIAYYVYSPIAGGFLTKTSAAIRTQEVEGRFSGKTMLQDMYNVLYGKETLFAALDEWENIARDAGVSKAALAYRWVVWHSALDAADGIVLGASSTKQLKETLSAIDAGPLDTAIAKRASDLWETVKQEAPRDNFQDYIAKQGVAPVEKFAKGEGSTGG